MDLRRILHWPTVGLAYLHEGLHFLTARLLGVTAKIVVHPPEAYVELGPSDMWQDLLITLAPALAGLLLLPLLLQQLQADAILAKQLPLALAWLMWMGSCAQDFQDAWESLRSRGA